MADRHREKVAVIERLTGPGPKRVLELGCGGGQHAAALAERGHRVVAVELVPALAAHARALAAGAVPGEVPGEVQVLEGDFDEIRLDGLFDVVCCWDGFGLGSDGDQRRLLRRIASWLERAGTALVDVYQPFHAAGTAGRRMAVGGARREYRFDAEGCRWIDEWWPAGARDRSITQSLRCYTPADLRLLLEGTGLRLAGIEPAGGPDPESGQWNPEAGLMDAIWYVARLVRA